MVDRDHQDRDHQDRDHQDRDHQDRDDQDRDDQVGELAAAPRDTTSDMSVLEPPPLVEPPKPDLEDPSALRAAAEAILFVTDSPLSVASLAAALQRPVPAVAAALSDLANELRQRGSGIELREVAGGVRLYTRPDLAPSVETFLTDGQRTRLTQAALETLAVIAYRQPVTRARISAIRGVNVDGVVRTLTARGLIIESGADPETGGGLYRTTELFLEKMGLQSLEQLPSLAPLLPEINMLDSDEL